MSDAPQHPKVAAQPEGPAPVYSDGVQVGCTPFTISLVFTVSPPPAQGAPAPQVVADIRMSPEHAKVMAIVLRRQLLDYEQQLGRSIPIHPQVMQQLGLSPSEDW